MKGFVRDDLLLSLCGLNCGLCTMRIDGYCPGCGGGEGNQSCAIARCSLSHPGVEYCSQCAEFPCVRYSENSEYDIFITRKNQMADLQKVIEQGRESYDADQMRKIELLKYLLEQYNDGRRKTFFSTAVNLLPINDLEEVVKQLMSQPNRLELPLKERAVYAAGLLNERAKGYGVELKLRKKTNKNKRSKKRGSDSCRN